MAEALVVSIVGTQDSVVDAGVVSALTGQVERLRHRGVVSRFVVVGGRSAVPALPADVAQAILGETAWESILPSEVDVVLLQDSSEDPVQPDRVAAVVAAVRAGAPIAVPVLPVTDTIKSLTAAGLLESTVDRSVLRRVASPWACVPGLLHGPVTVPVEGLTALPWQLGPPVLPVEADDAIATVRP